MDQDVPWPHWPRCLSAHSRLASSSLGVRLCRRREPLRAFHTEMIETAAQLFPGLCVLNVGPVGVGGAKD